MDDTRNLLLDRVLLLQLGKLDTDSPATS
jgi:hypothetical protein